MADQPSSRIDREAVAKTEIGVTAISKGTVIFLVSFFIVTLVTVPTIQLVLEWRANQRGERSGPPTATTILTAIPESGRVLMASSDLGLWGRITAANAVLLRHIDAYEEQLEEESFLSQQAIPRVQAFTARYLGLGNEKAYLGRDGWLFYRADVDYVTGPSFLDERRLRARAMAGSELARPPQPDPRKAILDFQQQLAERGIELVLVPTPVKPVIEPDRFSRAYTRTSPPLHNPGYARFIQEIRDAGVKVFDPTDLLADWRTGEARSPFLATDTHWRPEPMQAVAQALASYLRENIPLPSANQAYRFEAETLSGEGDIVTMLKLPPDQTLYPPETVTLRVVLNPGGEIWQPTRAAGVLLLGDSFSNIFSLAGMNWGSSAGFPEQLSAELGLPIDMILRNDAGARATREMLARDLASGRDRLEGKQVVVWQFAVRELATGDWTLFDLTPGVPRESHFYAPPPGAEPVVVEGWIQAVSPVPRPGSVPYRDHVFSVHLTDITGETVPVGAEAVVYMRSMADGVLTPVSRWRSGEKVRLSLRSWEDVSEYYERYNRSELDDFDLQLETPAWGEPINP